MTNRDKNIVGQILAKTYRIERFLGVGTVGTVYVARHVRSGGLYAVKILHRKLAASPDLYQRFQDEARLIATLRHPHILAITDFDRDENGIPFFVMDLLEGENLQQRLKHKESLPIAQGLEIIQQIGSALQTAHRSGIVHRNIKPENIFLVRHDLGDRVTESAKITDFGLARFRRMAPAGTRDASLGISAYMAPELLQETTTPIDGRADQWALAVIAYRMLSGKSPFDDENPEELLQKIINEPPRPFPKTSPELPAHMVAAISRGMSKRREDRYETMMDFVRALSSRSPSVATAEGGRVAGVMPPIPSGAAVPPPMPPAVSSPTPPPTPVEAPAVHRPTPTPLPVATATPSVQNPTPTPAPAPSRNTPTSAAASSSASQPAAPPPVLHAPPLLIPEEANVAPAPAPRGPSLSLLIGGGVIAVLAGVGLTLLWEQRREPKLPPPPPPITIPKTDTGQAQLVVEPLVPTAGADAGAALKGPVAPHVPVPPLRVAGDETVQPAAPGETPPVPAVPPAVTGTPSATPGVVPPQVAPTPGQVPPGTQVAPTATPPKGAPGTTPAAAGTPGATQAPTQPQATPPAATNSPPGGGSKQGREEVDELLGQNSGQTAPTARPNPGARPTATPGKPATETQEPAEAEKSADKILEEAQAAYVGGQRQKAIEMALEVTRRQSPNEVARAWRFIGSAACSVRSATLATRAYNNLQAPEHRQQLTELCKRNSLNFIDGQFVAE